MPKNCAQRVIKSRKRIWRLIRKLLTTPCSTPCVAVRFQVQQLSTDTASNKVTEHLGERLQIDVAACWRPTADNCWGRVNKAHALKMAKELIGASWSDGRSSLRKLEIAKSMENAFGETAHEAIDLNPEIADRTSRWLPDGMSFGDQEITKSPVVSENDPSASPKALPSFMDAAA
ncbi:MAG: hypothetical protein QM488_15970 [Rhizobiaceae bacterium]